MEIELSGENIIDHSNSTETDISEENIYDGKRYEISYLHYQEASSEIYDKSDSFLSRAVDKGINFVIRFARRYVWIPYALFGYQFPPIDTNISQENYRSTWTIIHKIEKNYSFIINGTPLTYAVFERVEVEDTTLRYIPADKEKLRYTSDIETTTDFYESPHYRDRTYALQKAEQMWDNNRLYGFWESVDTVPEMKVNTPSY